MLEVKNLTKVYKTKGGADTHALDGVSVQFPEKGMVFLLGKSGSGKSTLLNVCGGLDAPTSGEIIVKGRSSKDFTQSDFDSYRNTFIGFIFQEYNILNEFSVEDNIALALELQGKSKDKQAIAQLLEEVDLTGYAKRKPNTLSGGQKQRIAIARALVKAPEIIMADEPTGALDSATGKQVFDTLKKLSQDKLVIVVSHDRDFAELYGDRVIELKDGKIISDVSKTQEEQKALSANVTSIGDTLCVKKGAKLSDKDFEEIRAFLKNTDSDIIIATGEKDVKTFKDVSRITDDGGKEVFRDTDESKMEKKSYRPEESKFIRSKLPMRHAMKIGASGLKTKPFRLIFTVLLCTVAFVLFGLFSTMMVFDRDSIMRESLAQSSYDSLVLSKQYKVYEKTYQNGELDYEYESDEDTKFTATELAEMTTKFGSATFAALPFQNAPSNMHANNNNYGNQGYYSYSFAHATNLPENNSLRQAINGHYPEEGKNEICISTYMAESLAQAGLFNPKDQQRYTINNANDILDKVLVLNGKEYTVSGIFDSGTINTKYEALKDSHDWELSQEFSQFLSSGMYKVVFIDKATETELLAGGGDSNNEDMWQIYYRRFPDTYRFDNECRYNKFSVTDKYPVEILSGSTTLNAGEVIVNTNTFSNALSNAVSDQLAILQNTSQEEYNLLNTAYNQAENRESTNISERYSLQEKMNFLTSSTTTPADRATFVAELKAFLSTFSQYDFLSKMTISFELNTASTTEQLQNAKIVGFINATDIHNEMVYISDTDFARFAPLSEEVNKEQNGGHEWVTETKYVEDPNAVYSAIFIPFDRSETAINLLIETIDKLQEDDSYISLSNPISNGLKMADNLIENLSQVFLIVGIVLAAFAALLLSNFISVSISHKKRDIGILRAVGARSSDVFKIFFSESAVISVICIALSIIGSIIVCGALNAEVGAMLSGVSVFVFGPISIAMLIGLALATAVLATFFPVYKAAKKKPVDSIRAIV